MELSQEISKEVELHEELTATGAKITATYEGKYGKATFEVEADVIDLLRALAKKSDNKVDDMLVEMVAQALE